MATIWHKELGDCKLLFIHPDNTTATVETNSGEYTQVNLSDTDH